MLNTRTRLIAMAALGALAPIAADACAQYNPAASAQATDPTLAMIRQVEAQMNARFVDLDRLMAAQDAAMNAMFQQIDAMTAQALRNPGALQVAVPSGGNGHVSTVMISSVSNGQGMCSETATYTYGANGTPKVMVQKTGNACGADSLGNSQTPVYTPPQVVQPQAPHTIQIMGPARPVHRYVRG